MLAMMITRNLLKAGFQRGNVNSQCNMQFDMYFDERFSVGATLATEELYFPRHFSSATIKVQ